MKTYTIFNRPFSFLTEERQWVKLQEYLERYLFGNKWGKYAIILACVLVVIFLLTLATRGTVKKVLNHLLLISYIGVLVFLFILTRDHVRGIHLFDPTEYLTETGYHETRVLISVINCVMFVPFGIFLRKVSRKGHAIRNVLLVLLMAVGIEAAQFIFMRGYTAAMDVLCYVIGGFAGILLAAPFCLISEYLEERSHRKKGRRNPNRKSDDNGSYV